MILIGERYRTRGGWIAHISTSVNGNPQGECMDEFGNKEKGIGTWDAKTGECILRGKTIDEVSTKPYDIIDLKPIY